MVTPTGGKYKRFLPPNAGKGSYSAFGFVVTRGRGFHPPRVPPHGFSFRFAPGRKNRKVGKFHLVVFAPS